MNCTHWTLVISLFTAFWSFGNAEAQSPILWFDFANQQTENLGTLGPDYDGSLEGNASLVSFQTGFALSLDGQDDFLLTGTTPQQDAFNIANADFTLFARIQTTNSEPGANPACGRDIIRKQSTGCSFTYALNVIRTTGEVRLSLNGGGECINVIGCPVNDGVPHELVAVRDSGTLSLYVDNVLVGFEALDPGFGDPANADLLVIGGRELDASGSPCAGDDFNGLIDEIRIYASAVHPTTIVTEPFDRGDCNQDSAYNIADPIFLLSALFSGGTYPDCEDACDANDDGALNIADAVYSLTFLFSAGAAPPSPHQSCGDDPTVDGLCCPEYSPCP